MGNTKRKSFKIDLVLTEVELPAMSGFLLLSTIMEHDACKNIPVIMMSSNDAVSMVFKCMLKGAADFLVKPIRKNELRNLWQHVWRKQLANGGLDVKHVQQEENVAEQHEQKTRVTQAEHLIENVAACRNRECSEQESDAQSSCTRSELEAESKHTNSFLEFKQITGRHSSADPKSTKENGETNTQTARNSNPIPRKEGDLSPKRRKYPNDNNREKASRDIEVVHIIDDEQKDAHKEVDVVRTTSQGNADKWFWIPAHQLDLSLRRSDYISLEDHEKNDRRTLNHSTSSAFSLYNYRPVSSFGNVGDAQPCSTSARHADLENKMEIRQLPFKTRWRQLALLSELYHFLFLLQALHLMGSHSGAARPWHPFSIHSQAPLSGIAKLQCRNKHLHKQLHRSRSGNRAIRQRWILSRPKTHRDKKLYLHRRQIKSICALKFLRTTPGKFLL